MHKKILFVLETLLLFVLMLYFVTGCVLQIGLDEDLYFELQMRENVFQTAGISEEDLIRLDRALSESLRWGSTSGLETRWNDEQQEYEPFTVMVNGVQQPPFNEREIMHMEDCCNLFDLLQNVHSACFILVLPFALAVLIMALRDMKRMEWDFKTAWTASGIILIPIAFLALWAAIDFSSAFTFFHKLLFSNDLWLLDPRTDLLINICPSSMFANMGLRIAVRSFAVLLGFPLLVTIVSRIFDKRKKTTPTDA